MKPRPLYVFYLVTLVLESQLVHYIYEYHSSDPPPRNTFRDFTFLRFNERRRDWRFTRIDFLYTIE